MSEFHKAFYRNCSIHKDIEHPLWRKCPKCEFVTTYSEEWVKSIATNFAHDIQFEKTGDLDKMFDDWYIKLKKEIL